MEWWRKWDLKVPYDNINFRKILDFYLFNCPVDFPNGKIISRRAKSFKEYGIENEDLTKLLRLMKKSLSVNAYQCLKSDEDVEASRKKLEKNFNLNNKDFEFIIFKENTELKKTKSIYYAIRNSFAHGSFSIQNLKDNKLYCFENRKKGAIETQMKLKETTLLKWIELIKQVSKDNKLAKIVEKEAIEV